MLCVSPCPTGLCVHRSRVFRSNVFMSVPPPLPLLHCHSHSVQGEEWLYGSMGVWEYGCMYSDTGAVVVCLYTTHRLTATGVPINAPPRLAWSGKYRVNQLLYTPIGAIMCLCLHFTSGFSDFSPHTHQ